MRAATPVPVPALSVQSSRVLRKRAGTSLAGTPPRTSARSTSARTPPRTPHQSSEREAGQAAVAPGGDVKKARRKLGEDLKWTRAVPASATPLSQLALPRAAVTRSRVTKAHFRNLQQLLAPVLGAESVPMAGAPRCASTSPGRPLYCYTEPRKPGPVRAALADETPPGPSPGGSPRFPSHPSSRPPSRVVEHRVTQPDWAGEGPRFARNTVCCSQKRSSKDHLSPLLQSLLEETAAPEPAGKDDCDAASGFDTLQKALLSVARPQRDATPEEAASLDEKWADAGTWLSRLLPTKGVGAALACAQDAFEATLSATEGFVQPCNPRLAGTLKALDQLLAILTRFLPDATDLCSGIRRELHRSLFPSPPPDSAEVSTCSTDLGSSVLLDASAGDKYSNRRTFFQATRMLSQRLSGQISSAGQQELRRERDAQVWERIYRHSERRLLARVFSAWRQMRQREREVEALRRDGAATRMQLMAVERELQVSERTAAELEKGLRQRIQALEGQLEPVSGQLQAQLEQLSALRQRLKDKDDEIEKSREERKSGLDDARDNYEALCMVLFDSTERVADNPDAPSEETAWECRLRNRVAARVLDVSGEEDMLCRWVTAVLDGYPGSEAVLPFDLQQGQRTLDTFYTLLGALSPFHVSESQVRSFLALVDVSVKAQYLVEGCATLGVESPVSVADLAAVSGDEADRTVEAHQLFAASLFHRFTVVDPAERHVSFREADTGLYPASPTVPLSQCFSSEAILTAGEWRSRLAEVTQRASRWQVEGRRMLRWAWHRYAHVLKNKSGDDDDTDFREGLSGPEQRDFDAFTTVSTERAGELYRCEATCPDDASIERDVAETGRFLRRHFRRMRHAFQNFTLGTSPPRVALDQFWRQLVDAKVPDRNFTRVEVAKVFGVCNVDEDQGLDAAEWIIALLHLAKAKYRQEGVSALDKFRQLAEQHILKHHGGALTDEFKRQIYDSRVQAVISHYKKVLIKVFKYYAELDALATDRRQDAAREIEFTEFLQLMTDCKVLDPAPSVTQHAVSGIFARVLGNETLDVATQQQGMLLHEFVEGLVGVACLRFASPFTPLHQKVQLFLETKIFDPLDKKLKLGFERLRRRAADEPIVDQAQAKSPMAAVADSEGLSPKKA
eukprot:TRINITY_DN20230_c0_g1_i6.p1 TRINITY_DN20230_c0_g1~~TRINITY_DN20230_c0_g1_i6.p1  ORF type:complete len:1180 (+),score=270.83 TRINITY_DN20230_c0_g1_i6:135-3542(+)